MSIWRGKRPSDRIMAILNGKVPMEREEAGIQSACSRYIYDGAVAILGLPTKMERREVLDNVPPLVRPHLEREILRLHKARK